MRGARSGRTIGDTSLLYLLSDEVERKCSDEIRDKPVGKSRALKGEQRSNIKSQGVWGGKEGRPAAQVISACLAAVHDEHSVLGGDETGVEIWEADEAAVSADRA